MARYEITAPDGNRYEITAPDTATEAEILSYAQQNYQQPQVLMAAHDVGAAQNNRFGESIKKTIRQDITNPVMGALKGASDIGSTILWPLDKLGATGMTPQARRAAIGQFFKENADTGSIPFMAGELAADIAGTAGVGGVLAKGVRAIPKVGQALPKVAASLESGGFSLGGPQSTSTAGKIADAIIRGVGGAVTGAATAGAINPEQAGTGAVIGGMMPGSSKIAGAAGKKLAGSISPEVKALYSRAKELGIDVPADRIANSKPMNALAASLNYIPFSGRAATEEKMYEQMNRALSKTFGQDSPNVTMALRKAGTELGKQFDDVLKNNTVKVDDQLLTELQEHVARADAELETGAAKIIKNQVTEIFNKAQGDIVDGKAAYNIKKTLDRIANRNTPEAFYARDLKKTLMGALDRSLGKEKASAFKNLRQQYGNMLDLEGIAQNGAEGGVSVGRLANLKNIGNPELQELADIASQFIKTRENPHGALQRVVLGTLAGPAAYATGTMPIAAGGIALGRAANTALNSNVAKGLLTRSGGQRNLLAGPVVRSGLLNVGARP